ncbi:MAG: CHASE2 and HATPase_c domain-containing protein [Acidobacteria bacterium]|nr:CHASE2 and HATPase_c domain-containing protein [Acidobacteriota bacterium]
MNHRLSKQALGYIGLASLCLIFSILLGWSVYGSRINHIFYDRFFRQRGARTAGENIVIVAIDDATLARYGALPLDRSLLARAIQQIQQARPRLVAVDLLLADRSTPKADRDLEQALAGAAPVVLATALEAGSRGRWLLPLPEFVEKAAVLGHTHADPGSDGVNRQVLLAKQGDGQRYWALALECYRLLLGAPGEPVTETDRALEVAVDGQALAQAGEGGPAARDFPQGVARVPATRRGQRSLLINYAGGEGTFPQVSLASLLSEEGGAGQDRLRGKIVLLGVTAQATGDRLFTPFSAGLGMAGVEIHANILRTLLRENYLRPAGDFNIFLAVFGITLATAWVLARFQGLRLMGLLTGFGLMILLLPYRLFLAGQVWPAFSLLLPFGTTLLGCGACQLFSARRKFTESEARRRRSQQQFEMAAHEIRSPLTAILGSSELLSRYPLDEAKRKQIVDLIYQESQRLGKLVERFLSVERLAAGEMELQRVAVNLVSVLERTVDRLRPLAERKQVRLIREDADAVSEMVIEADPELLEFAVSNLLTNAVKYSPAGSSVRYSLERQASRVAVHISDSGPGMTQEESSRVFGRFFRTEAAENSGTSGFGLGLAIAREIARHHGGDVMLETKPGAGSRFSIFLPAAPPSGTPRPDAQDKQGQVAR